MEPQRQRALEIGQNAIIRAIQQHREPYRVTIKNVEWTMFPEVLNPNYGVAGLLLLDNLGVRPSDVVLDPFTGSGIDAIFAVREGAARAVAIDKHEMPYLCTRFNTYRLGVQDRVDVRKGDLFDALRPDEKFSLVVANPPFNFERPQSALEEAFTEDGYKTLRRFFSGIGRYLTHDGRMRIVFAEVGDMTLFHQLARDNGFVTETIARSTYGGDVGVEVYEMTTPQSPAVVSDRLVR